MKRYDLDKIKSEIRIIDYAQKMGFTLTKVGGYYSLAEHDSVRIDDRKNCFWRNSRFSQGQKANTSAGSIIDFVMHFENKDFKAALETLVDYAGDYAPSVAAPKSQYNPKQVKPEKLFVLPAKSPSNSAAINYLVNVRGIDKDIVAEYIGRKMIYQDKRNNAVFVGYNSDGKADFACIRGTYLEKRFVKDVEGCNYNNCIFINNNSKALLVTESIIDALSVMTFLGTRRNDYSYNALSGTGKIAAVLNNLKAHENIRAVIIAFDNDKAGLNAGDRLETILRNAGWQGEILRNYPKRKDWNDELLYNKRSLNRTINAAEAARNNQPTTQEHNEITDKERF